jgi:hypothetical protein
MDFETTQEMVLAAARRLGEACLAMEKADRAKSPDLGEKTDKVIRLRNAITQVCRDLVYSERCPGK